MGALDGRVAIITGAGRGIGREHALLFAREGAHVVVNDLGGGTDGAGADQGPAAEVVAEIEGAGGVAVANTDSVASPEGAERLVAMAVEHFGDLHVLVNNAGILRDRLTVNMTEEEWDAVVEVHMKGHYCPTRYAAAYWRDRQKAGNDVQAAIVNTSSGAGLVGNFGQLNYAAAKAGIAAMTIVEAMELGRYGVRSNCIAPVARTRLTLQTPGMEDTMAPPDDPGAFDALDPANISPLVGYLATAGCPITGGVFHVVGNEVGLFQGWTLTDRVMNDGRWSIDELANQVPNLVKDRPAIASQGSDLAALFSNVS